MVAALFVDARGVYANRPDVDLRPESRDARLYAGPFPVVAHPPCARWGRMAEAAFGRRYGVLGDDGGCFKAALRAVRRFGGVLEHPEASRAWEKFCLPVPPKSGGWVCQSNGTQLEWSCSVEQGHYGHRTRKATWLYAVGCELPSLKWGESHPEGFTKGASRGETYTRMSHRARAATQPAFAELLLSIARTARRSP